MKKFEDIYENYHQRVFSFILSFVNDRDQAKDTLQEVFVKFWEKSKKSDINNPQALLFSIAKNLIIDQSRRNKVNEKYVSQLDRSTQATQSVEQTYTHQETLGLAYEAIESLPARCKEVFKMSRDEGKSYQEIADALNISKNTVEVHMVKAMKTLRSSVASS